MEADAPTMSMTASGPDSAPIANPARTWGAFQLLELVGRGGFGEVYRAWDPQLNREVALKLLRSGGGDNHDYQAILKEARAAARVRHPNVIPVFGVDRFEGRVGFWSEFVRGKHLGQLVETQGAFGATEAALIGVEVCRAVAAVHGAGMLHRDIKASNVMREEGGRILLMDFGLTQEATQRHEGLSGTLLYMAPELLSGKPSTVASDIYALGVLLFYLTTGRYPKGKHLGTAPPRLIDERPDLPEPFVRVVETALATNPKDRYASAGSMMAALSGAVSPAAESAAPPPKSSKLWLGVALAMALGAGAFVYVKSPVGAPLLNTSGHAEYTKGQELLVRYDKQGSVAEATGIYEKLVKQSPQFALGQAGLADAYLAKFDGAKDPALLERARVAAAKAVELDSRQPHTHLALGKYYLRAGRHDLAAQELNEALRLDPRNGAAHAELGLLYQRQGRTSDVPPELQIAQDLSPNDWRWHNRLGLFYLNGGKLDLALEEFRRVTELTPDNRFGHTNTGLTYQRLGKFTEAMPFYQRALAIDPHFGQAMVNLGSLLLWRSQYPEAVKMYERATKEDANDYQVWAGLATAHHWGAQDRAQAQQAFRRAIEKGEKRRLEQPNDAELLVNLGSYYAMIGDRGRSLPLIRQSLAHGPDEPVILSRAAMGYEALGMREEAIAKLVRALQHGYAYDLVERNPELTQLRNDSKFIAKFTRPR